MTAKLSDDLQRAADAQADTPVAAEHDGTQKVYYIYTEHMHHKASQALRQQEDLDAIQAGIEAMEAGRTIPLAEADRRIRQELGFRDKVQ